MSLEYLKEIWRHGRLLPVLGAGMSIVSNLPSWNDLIKNLINFLFSNRRLSETWEIATTENKEELQNFLIQKFLTLSPIVSARYLKSIMRDPREFSHAVYNALYYDIVSEPIPSRAMLSITKFAKYSNVYLNYNFDDILERSFLQEGISAQSIYNQYQEIATDKITIYHPHGYLPYDKDIPWDEHYHNNDIVLSEDEYHEQYQNPYNWANTVQIKCLYENTLILFGLSANDPNLRRILEVASRNTLRKHYIVLQRDEDIRFSLAWKKLQIKIFDELGLNVIWIDRHEDIENLIEEIVES